MLRMGKGSEGREMVEGEGPENSTETFHQGPLTKQWKM